MPRSRKKTNVLLFQPLLILLVISSCQSCDMMRYAGYDQIGPDYLDIYRAVIQGISKLEEIPPATTSSPRDAILVLCHGQKSTRHSSLLTNMIFWNETEKIKMVQERQFNYYTVMHQETPLIPGYKSGKDFSHTYFSLYLPNNSLVTSDHIGLPVYKLNTEMSDTKEGFLQRVFAEELLGKNDRAKVVLSIEYSLIKYSSINLNKTIDQMTNVIPNLSPASIAIVVLDVSPEEFLEDRSAALEIITWALLASANKVIEDAVNNERVSFLWKPQQHACGNESFRNPIFKHDLDRIVQETRFSSVINPSVPPFKSQRNVLQILNLFSESNILNAAWTMGGVDYRLEEHEKLCLVAAQLEGNETMNTVLTLAMEGILEFGENSVKWLKDASRLTKAMDLSRGLAITNATEMQPTRFPINRRLNGSTVGAMILEKYGGPCKPALITPMIPGGVTCSENSRKVTVFGKTVKLSDLVSDSDSGNSVLPCDTGDLKELQIFATENVVLDKSIIAVGRELKLVIVAPTWEIVKMEVEINLNGKTGQSHIPPVIVTAPEQFGVDGVDGLPGNPGADGGSFVGIYGNFTGNRQGIVKISTMPGNGGDGQGGGPGADGGPPGKDAKMEDMPPADLFLYYQIPLGANIFRDGNKDAFVMPGEPGGTGGGGGIGGAGGFPGRPGQVAIMQLSNPSVAIGNQLPHPLTMSSSSKARYGRPGRRGNPGKGSPGGKGWTCTLMNGYTTPEWGDCGEYARNRPGRDGFRWAYRASNVKGIVRKLEQPQQTNLVLERAIDELFNLIAGERNQSLGFSDNEFRFLREVRELKNHLQSSNSGMVNNSTGPMK